MTILSMILPDGTGKDLDVTNLFKEIKKDPTTVDLAMLLPSTHLSQNYYTDAIQGALLAILTRLRASQDIKSLHEIFKPEQDLTPEELCRKTGSQHNITTINNVSWIRMNVPVYEENPEVAAVVNEFNVFIDFLKEGHESGADLANSDYPEEPVEQVAPVEEAPPALEPTVVDGVPEEAQAEVAEEAEPVVVAAS